MEEDILNDALNFGVSFSSEKNDVSKQLVINTVEKFFNSMENECMCEEFLKKNGYDIWIDCQQCTRFNNHRLKLNWRNS